MRAQHEPVDPSSVEVTRAIPAQAPPVPPASPKAARPAGHPRRWPFILLGLLLVILFGGAGTWMGYRSAVDLRKTKLADDKVRIATEHFMLGMQAQTAKQFAIAQQQFEYVIRLDPNFPGAQDKLREVMVASAIKNTPTPVPTQVTPTLTPTKDLRPQEEIFNQAKQQFAAQDWNALFATIDSLRAIDPKYRAVEIDDMLYFALRFRGIDKILHQANLEGGLYDLALAEKFGPLDQDAKGYRNWARLYLNGSSFWEVDWKKVAEAFEQIYPYFPNMRDSSALTAIERYRIAAQKYGDQLEASGDPCGAFDYYKKSLSAVPDGQLEATATAVYLKCYPPTATVTPTVPVTPTTQQVTPSEAATTPAAPTAEATTPPAGGGSSALQTTPKVTETPKPPAR